MRLGISILAIKVLRLFFPLFDAETDHRFHPFAPSEGVERIVENWRSFAFLNWVNISVIFYMSIPLFFRIGKIETAILFTAFVLTIGEYIDEIFTARTPYFGTVWFTGNFVSIVIFAIYLRIIKWRYSTHS